MKRIVLFFSMFSLVFLLVTCSKSRWEDPVISEDFDQTIHHLAKSYISALPDQDLSMLDASERKLVELGKKLFYEKKLSGSQTISCASCHDIARYGVDNRALSFGDKNQVGVRNSQTVLNTFLYGEQNWDTKFKTVEDQVMGPIFSELEMAMPGPDILINRLNEDPFYVKAFTEAFPGDEPAISMDNIKKAIGSFERTLLTPSRFDEYLKGDLSALTTTEKLGVHSFVINCKSCHSSALVGAGFAVEYPIFGRPEDYSDSNREDLGRYEVTKDPEDIRVFKVPQLRNVEKTFPYMHDGSVKTLEEAIQVCSMAESNYRLPEKDVEYIAAFLRTLTGKIPEHALENNPTFR